MTTSINQISQRLSPRAQDLVRNFAINLLQAQQALKADIADGLVEMPQPSEEQSQQKNLGTKNNKQEQGSALAQKKEVRE